MTGGLYEVAGLAFHVLEIICKRERSTESGVFEFGIPPVISQSRWRGDNGGQARRLIQNRCLGGLESTVWG